ncbi:hypothetical protein ABZ490_38465 [Streptomyces sp. NPDC005811]|uniref:hypothetical protein n=1 Tax=Streptomyces sp. NPDC005811 TaxID=3154565 RepID=UPI0034042D2B
MGEQSVQLRLKTVTPLASLARETGRDPLTKDVPRTPAAGARLPADRGIDVLGEVDIEQDAAITIGVVRGQHVDRQNIVQPAPQPVQRAARTRAAVHRHQPGAVGVRREQHPATGPVELPGGSGSGQGDLDSVLAHRHEWACRGAGLPGPGRRR